MNAPSVLTRRQLFKTATAASLAIGLSSISAPYSEAAALPLSRKSKNLGAMVFVKQGEFEKDLAATVAAGFTWIRMDIPIGSYGWFDGGQFRVHADVAAFYRKSVRQAKAAGLKIVLVMASMYNNDGWSEAQFRKYNGRYVSAVSANIGKYVDLWQIFNEHDGRDYRNHAPIKLTASYMRRMRDTLGALRSSLRKHSKAPITTTPFGYPVDKSRYNKWVKFFDGIGSSLDVICIHAYPEKGSATISKVPSYMKKLRKRYKKPVGILEFGLPSVRGYGSASDVGRAVVAQIAAIMSADPFVATMYQLRDRGRSTTDGEQAFGMLNHDWSRKQYYGAVTAEVRKWR